MKRILSVLLSCAPVAVWAAVVPVESVKNPASVSYDLGYKLTSDMSVTLKVSFDEKGAKQRSIFGARSAAAKQNISVNFTDAGLLVADFGNHGSDYDSYRSMLAVETGVVYTVTLDKSGTSIVGGEQSVRASKGWTGASYTTPGNAYLFDLNGVSWEKAATRFYGCTVKNASGTIVHDYIPALDDGIPCIYDAVAKSVLAPRAGGSLTYDDETYDVRLPYVKMTRGMSVDCSLASSAGLTATRTFRTLDDDGVGALTSETIALDALTWTDQQLYSLKVFDGETLMRELVPAVKDGGVRLYDRVTRRFATVTDGELTTDCGAPYDKALDFCNTYGDVVYDLGYPLSSDMTIVYKLEYIGGNGTFGLFGARDAAGSRNISVNFGVKDKVATLAGDFNNADHVPYRASMTIGGSKVYTVTLKNSKVTISDGKTTTTAESAWTGEAFTTSKNAYLFNINGSTFNDANVRFYGCTVKNAKGIVLHNYIPVVKGGVGLIYDTVDGVMLANTKTGNVSSPGQTYLTAEAVKDARGVAETITVKDADGKGYPYGVYVVADTADRGENTTNGWAFVSRVGSVPAHLGAGSWTFAMPEKVIRRYPAFRVVTIPEFDETSYVRDGLVALWDAKANAAQGYDKTSTWKDLIGRADFVNANWSFGSDAVTITKGNETTANLPAGRLPLSATKTGEIVCRVEEGADFASKTFGILFCVCNDLVLFFRNSENPIVPRFTYEDGSTLTGYFYSTEKLTVADAKAAHSYSLTSRPGVVGSTCWTDAVRQRTVVSPLTNNRIHQSGTTHADSVRIGPDATKGDEYASVARIYDRELTYEERQYNAKIDAIRYRGTAPWIKSSGAMTTENRGGMTIILR